MRNPPQPPPTPRERDPTRPWTVHAVTPVFNRPVDAHRLLGDLAAQNIGQTTRLLVTVIDNASTPALKLDPPPGLLVTVIRLESNRGGSGGFNEGLRIALARPRLADAHEAVWLLDSDARVHPEALTSLLEALTIDAGVIGAGSVLHDPATGVAFEAGGKLDPRTGELRQFEPTGVVTQVDYLAACSLLVMRAAVEAAGLLPDVFVNGDDAAWCRRLTLATGGRLVSVPGSIAWHPRPDRMRTWDRYYAARNAISVINEFVPGVAAVRARGVRALRETARAAAQTLVGRSDLAALHLQGLRDAAKGITTGPSPQPMRFDLFSPITALPNLLTPTTAESKITAEVLIEDEVARAWGKAIDGDLRAAGYLPVLRPRWTSWPRGAWRAVFSGRPELAVVSARARPCDWLAGRRIIATCPLGVMALDLPRWRTLASCARTLASGSVLALRLSLLGGRTRAPRIPAPTPEFDGSLSVIILSYNRRAALDRTIRALLADPAAAGAQIIVADNASTDGSVDHVRAAFPSVEVVALPRNTGVEGFSAAAERATGRALLVLDDDAAPAPGVLERAITVLRGRPGVGAVALLPVHPATGRAEWAFGQRSPPRDDWPVMGCGNLIRTELWRRLGGYESEFFLYRNDTDLALSLRDMGWGVHFDPALIVHHDSPASKVKSVRWCRLATRNWIWMCRRHAHRGGWVAMALAGWAWAHRQAGLRPRAHCAALAGAWRGLASPPPKPPRCVPAQGAGLRELQRLRCGRPRRAAR